MEKKLAAAFVGRSSVEDRGSPKRLTAPSGLSMLCKTREESASRDRYDNETKMFEVLFLPLLSFLGVVLGRCREQDSAMRTSERAEKTR